MNENVEHENIVTRYLDIVKELDDIDEWLSGVNDRKSDIDTRLSDIDHFVEELDRYNIQLTPKQCQKLIELIKDFRQIRRGFKKEQYLNDVLEANKAKIGYGSQRQMLIAELCRKEKSLDTAYKPRILTYEEILDMITDTRGRGRRPKNVFRNTEGEKN